jgi:hypothetical protein
MCRCVALLTLLIAVGNPLSAASADTIALSIRHFGLEGAYNNSAGPTWVQISARNASGSTRAFELNVAELGLDNGARPVTESFTIPIALVPGEERLVNIPLHVVGSDQMRAVIFAEARAGGVAIGRTGRRVEAKTEGQVLAALCGSEDTCRAIRQSIFLSGSADEQSRKSQTLHLIQLSEAPDDGWAYSLAEAVIVATPSSRLSQVQRDGLETYLLRGGKLILVEDRLEDSAGPTRFLDAYRAKSSVGKVFPVGSGKLIRLPSVSSKYFTDYFRPFGFTSSAPGEAQELLMRFRQIGLQSGSGTQAAWLLRRLGTSFRFPSFAALLLWIVGYLLLVGVVNFVILRRLGRPELGWITIPSLAIAFSIALYVVSMRTHPSNFGLDEMTVYRLTNLSSLATSETKIRVSAPVRAVVRPVLPGKVVYSENQNNFIDGIGFTVRGTGGPPTEIQLGQTWQTNIPLRRWSFRDLHFEGARRFAGTVHLDSSGLLHNDTGVNFRQAILANQTDVFVLGEFPGGAAVDLRQIPHRPYQDETGHVPLRAPGYPGPPFLFRKAEGEPMIRDEVRDRFNREFDALSDQPFSIGEMIRGWPRNGPEVFSDTKAVFFGLSSEAALGAALHDLAPTRKAFFLSIVTFGEWP